MRQPDNVRRLTVIPDSRALGQWVKQRREELGMSQEVLGVQCRCKKSYISKVEKATPHSIGKVAPAPTLKFLHYLSKALGTSIAVPLGKLGYLKTGADMETSPHPIRILHYYNQLSEEDRKLAEEMVKALWTRRHLTEEKQPKPKTKVRKKKTA